MTTLLIQELRTELTHDFRLGLNVRHHIAAFIPYLYVHNNPAGVFTFEVLKDAESIYSYQFGSNEIAGDMGETDDYAHAFYPIMPDTMLQLEGGSYQAKLSATGYAPSDSSFLGWIQQHEDIQNEMEYTSEDDNQNPLAMRIKVFKQGVLCQG